MYKTFRYEVWGDLNLHLKNWINMYPPPPTHFLWPRYKITKSIRGECPPPPHTTKQHRLGFSWNLSYENTMLQPTPTEIRIFIIMRSCPFLSVFISLFKIFGWIATPPSTTMLCACRFIVLLCNEKENKFIGKINSEKKVFMLAYTSWCWIISVTMLKDVTIMCHMII